ncbi:MAG: T9SS type A sorting domain-containing protein [Crocinitomicaceae bacterium]|nr:T9SS type A sorting domain-containing protein [Crocinitomicaceae bacterium]
MKYKLLLLNLMLFFASQINAQIVSIYEEGVPGTLYNGDTVFVNGTESVIYPHLIVENTSGGSLDLKWKRLILSSTQPGFTDQLCDNILCFNCTGNPWVRPTTISLADGATTTFQPKLNTGGVTGGAHFRYYVTDGSGIYIDSVDVVFNTTVGINENVKISYNAYPNPAGDIFNIQLKVSANTGNNYQVKIFNLMGELVSQENLVVGLNVISTEEMTNGIYFYSIVSNSNIIETRKLIIKK